MSHGWRVLLVGCGWIARRVHLPYLAGLRAAGQLRSLLVADTDPVRAEDAARAVGAAVHAGSVGEAGADLVLVATWPASHATLILDALASGAHVIVEKPLALTAGDAARIVDAAVRHDRGVYPLYTLRHRPEIAVIRRALGTWTVGQVREVRTRWWRHRGVPATAGGIAPGVLWDIGSHLADIGLYLVGWGTSNGTATAWHQHRTAPGALPRADWQTSSSGEHCPRLDWYGVSGAVELAPAGAGSPGRLGVEASWHAPGIERDEAWIEIVGDRVLTWRTVFGWSPDRHATPGPAVWTSRADGGDAQILLGDQPRDPRVEYSAQLDAAVTVLTAYERDPHRCHAQLRPAVWSTAVLHALHASLTTATAQPIEIRYPHWG